MTLDDLERVNATTDARQQVGVLLLL